MDVRTMALMGAAVTVLLAVVLFAQYRLNRGYAGPGWWAAGQASVAAGILVSDLRGDSFIGRLAVPAYQALLVLGTVLLYVGVLRFLGRRERWGWLAASWLALVLWSTFHTFVDDNATLRAMGLYLALAVVLAASAVALWRFRLPAVRGSATFLAVVFAATSLTYLLLVAAEPLRTQVGNPFYAPSPVNAVAFITAVASTLLWTFGLVVMVNQRLSAEVALEARNMRSVFATGPDCALISRLVDGEIEDVNEGFTRLTGFTREQAIGRTTVDLGLWADPAAREAFVAAVNASGSLTDFPLVLRRSDGGTLDCVIATSTLTLDDQRYLISVIRDVTQQRRMEAELLHEASTDSLTGLPNRRYFLAVCDRELRRSVRSGAPLSVAVIDIDHFKDINDSHGHAAGDEAVVAFAQAVTACIRDIDTFGRLGGDEFGLLLPDADLERARLAVERVREHLSDGTVTVGPADLPVTFSAGVAQVASDLDSIDTLLAHADKALYEAKERGRNRVVAATP